LNKLDLLLLDKKENGSNNNNNSAAAVETTNLKFGGTYEISCVTQQGIDGFLKALTGTVLDRTTQSGGGDGALITRARHRQHVEAAVEALDRFGELSQQGSMAVDMAAEELRLAASELGRITGAVDVEDVLDVLFSDFCIGK
jgi:tRNA modification GTPase